MASRCWTALPLQPHEEFVPLDTSDLEAFRTTCEGVDTVVHLAVDPRPDADFHTSLLSANVVGVYNAFEAAAQAGCKRLIFASSVHAMLGYSWGGEPDSPRPHTTVAPVNQPNLYGATKCWGEALCRVYSNSRELSCIAIRLTSPANSEALTPEQQDGATQQGWLSQGDAGRLFASCVDAADDLKFGLLNGISDHETNWLDISNARALVGYRLEHGAHL
jgi:NAD+ dependent glucose-6-phosphate dehydrogenase